MFNKSPKLKKKVIDLSELRFHVEKIWSEREIERERE